MGWLNLRRTLLSCQSVVWVASWLVPGTLRSEWRAQTFRKIYHWVHFLAEHGQLDPHYRGVLLRHSWKAFPEALWLRFDRDQFLLNLDRRLRAPGTVLAACLGLLLALILTGGFISRSHYLLTSAIAQPDRVVTVSFDGKYTRIRSETLLYLATVWRDTKLAKELAIYSWGPGKLSSSDGAVPVIEARVSPEFFHALGVSPELGKLPEPNNTLECANCVVLSHDFWKMRFGGNRAILGSTIDIDGYPHVITAVLPANFHVLSSSILVWTSLDRATLRFSNFMNHVGAVASLQDGATVEQVQRDLADLSENAGYRFSNTPMRVATLRQQFRRTVRASLAFLFLALISAVGIAWILRSGSGLSQVPLAARDRLRWWAFFAAKSASLVAVAYLGSWMLVHAISGYVIGSLYPMADEISIWTFLPIAVALLSWSMLDQQKRCRVCLSRLSMPIDIGRPGSVLLNWAGTEMVCSAGHGTLYLPESQANWLERDRWSALDESWASLFRGTETETRS